jgi:class 3 adenylate cyclase
LLVKGGPLLGRRLHVETQLVLGRGDADVVIEDPEISRRHALIRERNGAVEIEDLDSLNGTWVNGQRIKSPARLEPGDVIRLGKTTIEVEADDTAATTDPELTTEPPGREPEPAEPEPAEPEPEEPWPATVDPDEAALEELDVAPDRVAAVVSIEAGRCPECGAEVPSQARFCAYCGVAVDTQEPAPPAPAPSPSRPGVPPEASADDELRPVTALFADVVGSTALGERLAPHEVKALIGECVNRMARAVEQYGGSIDAYMGDGIAAFFGMPAAHEDDPERAAHAALRILGVVAEYARDVSAAWGVEDFNVRVGINSGQTAVGLVGGAEQQVVALGDTTNVAARLQSSAAPGTIVVGGSTARRLAHRFVLESLGEISVKGRAQPVAAWRLVRLQEGTRAPAPTPLVGREAEAARLRAAVEEVVEGRGQVLLLVGDAGIGKTRMVSELRTIAEGRAVWLEGHCHSYGTELLYGPFVDVLRHWLGVESGEAEVSVRTKLRAKLAGLPALDATELVTPLGRLLGLQGAPQEAERSAGPEELARELRAAYAAWLEALTQTEPVVLALDDLHWADAPTRELAEELLEVTDRAPLLLTVALRGDMPSEGYRFRLHALEHFSHRAVELPLGPLSKAASEELLGMLVPEGLDEVARVELVTRAEGNPLYLEELLRSLIEEGGLERRRRTWALTVTPASLVPAALEGLLVSRIDHLPESPRRLLQVAAVVGRTFPADALERVSRSETFERDLSTLLRAQFIRELRRYPQLVYTFKHGLLQEAALSTLTPARLEQLYGRVAAVFEELYAGSKDEYLEVLASYYARSRNLEKALEYLERAGGRAVSLDASTQAVHLLKRAREVATKLQNADAEQRIGEHLDRLGP